MTKFLLTLVLLYISFYFVSCPCGNDNDICNIYIPCCNDNCNGITNRCTNCHPFGYFCATTQDCCPNLVCDGKCSDCIKPNSPYKCKYRTDCCSEVCIGGYCKHCSKIGVYCVEDPDCCSGYYCKNNQCVNCIQPRDNCNADAQCCSLSCANGNCAMCTPVGYYCTSNDVCCSERCRLRNNRNRCLCTRILGQRCVFHRDCCPGLKCGIIQDPNSGIIRVGCVNPL